MILEEWRKLFLIWLQVKHTQRSYNHCVNFRCSVAFRESEHEKYNGKNNMKKSEENYGSFITSLLFLKSSWRGTGDWHQHIHRWRTDDCPRGLVILFVESVDDEKVWKARGSKEWCYRNCLTSLGTENLSQKGTCLWEHLRMMPLTLSTF